MTFYSLHFLLFLLIVFIVYYLIPLKYRYIWLTAASLFFYATYGTKMISVLLGITVISFTAAQLINREKAKKPVLIISIILIVCIWFSFKLHFFSWIVIGVSFYSLAAIAYVVDVYKKRTECENNFLKYLLFISFFPTVISGPIERSSNLLAQIKKGTEFSFNKAKRGILLILYGLFLKCLIADRMISIVNPIIDSYSDKTGAELLWGFILAGFQVLADFSGYTYIASGIASMLGFRIADNFIQPYLSTSIKDFWSRWHISLSFWFRDYIYFPLGGSRKGKARAIFNTFITFIASGIWHGTGFQFIAWGFLNGLFQAVYTLTRPMVNKFESKFNIKQDRFCYKLPHIVLTVFLIDFLALFIHAPSLTDAMNMLAIIFGKFELGAAIIQRIGLEALDYERRVILVAEMLIWLAVDILHERKISISRWLDTQSRGFRWSVYMFACIVVIIGMLYNFGLDASTFIYARF